ncbi:hypothetical protein F5Y17DRAFT_264435 [Xylariaceae sp. FL0594]|nr:hypothetical protein F5Y17DRAFT_264435 [Xylariaceae sp. FL0594]
MPVTLHLMCDAHYIDDPVCQDPGLTEYGKHQCERVAANFTFGDKIDIIYTSPLARAIESAIEAFPQYVESGKAIVPVPMLSERWTYEKDKGHELCVVKFRHSEYKLDYKFITQENWHKIPGQTATAAEFDAKRGAEVRTWLRDVACGRLVGSDPTRDAHIVVVTHQHLLTLITEDIPNYHKLFRHGEIRSFQFVNYPGSSEDGAPIFDVAMEAPKEALIPATAPPSISSSSDDIATLASASTTPREVVVIDDDYDEDALEDKTADMEVTAETTKESKGKEVQKQPPKATQKATPSGPNIAGPGLPRPTRGKKSLARTDIPPKRTGPRRALPTLKSRRRNNQHQPSQSQVQEYPQGQQPLQPQPAQLQMQQSQWPLQPQPSRLQLQQPQWLSPMQSQPLYQSQMQQAQMESPYQPQMQSQMPQAQVQSPYQPHSIQQQAPIQSPYQPQMQQAQIEAPYQPQMQSQMPQAQFQSPFQPQIQQQAPIQSPYVPQNQSQQPQHQWLPSPLPPIQQLVQQPVQRLSLTLPPLQQQQQPLQHQELQMLNQPPPMLNQNQPPPMLNQPPMQQQRVQDEELQILEQLPLLRQSQRLWCSTWEHGEFTYVRFEGSEKPMMVLTSSLRAQHGQ